MYLFGKAGIVSNELRKLKIFGKWVRYLTLILF